MESFDDEESLAHTLLIIREVHIYKIPPRPTSGGFKCSEWLVSDRIWTGRLRLLSEKDVCKICFEDSSTGELFAACPVKAGFRDASVESVADSSRYFVVRVDDGEGHHAFLGLGFMERNEAFDFNVALTDHEKHALREKEEKSNAVRESTISNPATPSHDYRLKEGETIRINVKTKPTAASIAPIPGKKAIAAASSLTAVGAMKAPLAPPPGGFRLRRPLPPPPAEKPEPTPASDRGVPGSVPAQPGAKAEEGVFNFTSIESSLPALPKLQPSNDSAKQKPIAAGWAAF